MTPVRCFVSLVAVALASCAPAAEEKPAAPTATVSETFKLLGNEPFWAVYVDSAGLRYVTPDDTAGKRFPVVAPERRGDTLVWSSTAAAGSIEAKVVAGECSDGMSDRVWPFRSWVRVDSLELTGCAARN